MTDTTQRNAVLDHLLSGKTLTKIEAFELCGTLNLGDIVYCLKKQGYKIDKEFRINLNSGRYYADYFLIPENKV